MFDIQVKEFFEGLILIIVFLTAGYKTIKEYIIEKKYVRKNNLTNLATFNQNVYEKMVELRMEFNADRILLFRFHNGQTFIGESTNNSIVKMTCTHETVHGGVEKILKNYQAVLVSNYPNFLKTLVSNNFLAYEDLSHLNDDDTFAYEMKHNANESLYLHKICSKNNNVIGFIIICYTHLNKKPILNFEYFEEKIKAINYLINKD